jgi:MFS transporter, PPP family, 3-phenylpropionic acid transporter
VNSNALRLAAGYFMYFGAVGIFAPFWSPYLALRGFGPVEIGLLIALVAAARAIVPMALGWIADATQRPTRVLQIAAGLAVACFALFPWQSGLLSFGLLSLLFGAFWNTVIPLYDAHALDHLGTESHRYGRLRLWGSIGFVVVTSIGGLILQHKGYQWVPWLVLPPMIGAFLMTLTILPMTASANTVSLREVGSIVRSRAVVAALVVATLVIMSSGAYYAFFSIWLEMNHYSKSTIGLLWAVGVLAEVGVFAMGQSLLARFTIRTLFIAAAAGTALRWVMVAWCVSYPVLLTASQLLHCLSFAVLHFAIVLTAHRAFPAGLQSTGQSLFSSVAYGGGGLAGALLAGVIWASFSARASYVTAAFIVVLATVCAVLGLRGTTLDRQS